MKLIDYIPDEKKDLARKLITEVTFMRSQLVGLRKDIKENGTTEWYVNGKQECERIRPAADLYVRLSGRYSTLIRQISDMVDSSLGEIDELDAFLAEV